MIKRPLKPNLNSIALFLLSGVLVVIIIYNLFGLQVVKGSEYYFDSKNSSSYYVVDRSQRGLIYDRNGVKLVDNIPKFRVSVVRKDVKTENLTKTLQNLAKIFSQNVEEKYDTEYQKIKTYPNINEVKLFTNLDYNPYIFQIEANPDDFPLIRVEKYTQRKYLYPDLMSHIIGYTGEIDAEDFASGKYNYGDQIGKFGIEKTFDDTLRGQNGIVRIENFQVDSQTVNSNVQNKVNGKDLYLTIDINYQKMMYDAVITALKRSDLKDAKSISSVVEDINNGQIVSMVSYPTFNANDFVQGISQAKFDEYLNNPGKPLTNKAIQYAQSPGSTFKILTDVAALNAGAITKDTIFSTGGKFDYGGVTFYDAGGTDHGDLNMSQALCVSSNIFHMKTALALDAKTKGQGSETISALFKEIGLNQPSGINIGTESTGYFPTPEDKRAAGQNWYTGYLMNSSIGQGDVRLSPIGAVKLVATIANGGNVIPQSMVLSDQNSSKSTTQLNVNKSIFVDVKDGMRCAADAAQRGIIFDRNDIPPIGLKTGTAETGQLDSSHNEIIHGWEISYGPAVNPKYAVSVFMENGGGGWKGALVSREFYKYVVGKDAK